MTVYFCAAVAPTFLCALYEDTDNGRAPTHQLYSFAIEVWYAPMGIIKHPFGPRFGDFAGSSLSILTRLHTKSPNLGPAWCPMIPTLQ